MDPGLSRLLTMTVCAHPSCNAQLDYRNGTRVCRHHSHSKWCRCSRCADPVLAEANRERLRAMSQDHRSSVSAAMVAWHASPENNPLAALSARERADYDALKHKARMSRSEALTAIGRGDLID